MKVKVREIISEVRNDLKLLGLDDWVPAKYIYFKLLSFASVFIKRDGDSRKLFKYSELWTTIKCLEMVEDDLINCCNVNIPNCTKVMRSKEKLPALYTTRAGYLINVMSVDYMTSYTMTSAEQYKYTQSREFIDPRKRYCWIENEYLIIPDSNVEIVTAKGIFVNKQEALKLDNCYKANGACSRLLDEDFPAPPYLIKDIREATANDILGKNRQIPKDEQQNLNSNEKSTSTP